MLNRKRSFWLAALLVSAPAWSALNAMPAARVHVRQVDGVFYRYTSKLANVVEMNFTLNFNHTEGKATIDAMLTRIAADYGADSIPAFAIRRFTGPGKGASVGLPDPLFTLEDLQASDVIVTNNVSNLNILKSRSLAAATAFETAVRNGKSVLGFHASAEGGTGWAFYDEFLNPRDYQQHNYSIPIPVYRDSVESRHVALEGVLAAGTPAEVPMGIDAAGNEILRKNVEVRKIRTEADSFGKNLLTDSIYAPLTTPLLRYDPRDFGSMMPVQSRFPGGNLYAFFVRSGTAKSAYFSGGHDNSELTTGSGFDGGTGEFERFYAQLLFFLAGYKSEPCGGTVDCSGLPLVDGSDRIIGSTVGIALTYGRPDFFPSGRIGFRYAGNGPWQARLVDVRGRTIATREGRGNADIRFSPAGLKPGVYFLRVGIGSQAPRIKRYALPMIGADAVR